VAFVTLAALAIGGVLCSQIQTLAAFLFPLAGAVIRCSRESVPRAVEAKTQAGCGVEADGS
jgi:hypothetical protein